MKRPKELEVLAIQVVSFSKVDLSPDRVYTNQLRTGMTEGVQHAQKDGYGRGFMRVLCEKEAMLRE